MVDNQVQLLAPMSETFYLVGHRTKTYLWVGQGNSPDRLHLYTGQPENHGRQSMIDAYLAVHMGSELSFVSAQDCVPGGYFEVVPALGDDGEEIYFVPDPEEGEAPEGFEIRYPDGETWQKWRVARCFEEAHQRREETHSSAVQSTPSDEISVQGPPPLSKDLVYSIPRLEVGVPELKYGVIATANGWEVGEIKCLADVLPSYDAIVKHLQLPPSQKAYKSLVDVFPEHKFSHEGVYLFRSWCLANGHTNVNGFTLNGTVAYVVCKVNAKVSELGWMLTLSDKKIGFRQMLSNHAGPGNNVATPG